MLRFHSTVHSSQYSESVAFLRDSDRSTHQVTSQYMLNSAFKNRHAYIQTFTNSWTTPVHILSRAAALEGVNRQFKVTNIMSHLNILTSSELKEISFIS